MAGDGRLLQGRTGHKKVAHGADSHNQQGLGPARARARTPWAKIRLSSGQRALQAARKVPAEGDGGPLRGGAAGKKVARRRESYSQVGLGPAQARAVSRWTQGACGAASGRP